MFSEVRIVSTIELSVHRTLPLSRKLVHLPDHLSLPILFTFTIFHFCYLSYCKAMAPFTIHQAVPSDLDEMVDVWVQACKEDTNWRMMMGSMTEEQEYAFVKDTIRSRVEIGVRIGASQSW